MAHQEDYRGPQGGYGNEMQGRDMQGGMQGRGSRQWGAEEGGWGRNGPDQYGMESGGNWQRQGERYGQGQNWQGPHGESFRGGQGDQGQGGSWNESRWEQGRGGPAWQGGGRDYGWSPSQGYNTQPYSSGGYYGGGGYYGRDSYNPSYGNFNPGTYGGQQTGRGMGPGAQRGEYASGYAGEPMFSGGGMYGNYGSDQMERQGGFGRQSHAGRGPRGYRRSDDRIREDVNEELTRHPEIDASEIEVRVEHGEVTLTGMVEDRRAKRLAEDIAERCSGVEDVRNELHVDRGRHEEHEGHEAHEGRSSRHGGMSDREVPRRTASETSRSGGSGSTTESRTASGAGGSSGTHTDTESNRNRSTSKSGS